MNTKKALATIELIRTWDYFLSKHRNNNDGYDVVEIQYLFCRLYNQHQIVVNADTYQAIPRLSRATFCRFLKRYQEQGIDACGVTWGGKRIAGTTIEKNPALKAAIEKYIALGSTKFGPAKILKLLETQEKFEKLPSEFQIRNYIKKFRQTNPMVWLELQSRDKAKNSHGIAFGSFKTSAPNEVWELDGSPSDVLIELSDGGVRKRFQPLFLIDRYTRDLTIDVAPAETSKATKELLRKAIAQRGITGKIVTDNASGFKDSRTQLMLERLGIELQFCPPGKPEKKPFVERVVRTFQDAVAILPGYIGKNTDQRKDLRSNGRADCDGLLTLEQFKEWVDQWVNNYRTSYHNGLECSPIEKIAEAASQGFKPEFIKDSRVLDFLLLEDRPRTVQKKGIRLNNRWYIAPELGGLIGSSVHVCWDSHSAEKIYVYSDDLLSNFICTAEWTEAEGIDTAKVAKEAKAVQKEVVAAAKTLQKEAKKVAKKIQEDPLSVLDKGTVEPFVQKVETTNEDLQQLVKAVQETLCEKETEKIDELAQQRQEKIKKERAIASQSRTENKPMDASLRLKELVSKKQVGEVLTEEEQTWMDRYVATPSGRVLLNLLSRNTA